jgi:hypothetical protein
VKTAAEFICATLRGEEPEWLWPDEANAADDIVSHAEMHGVEALLNSWAVRADWPQSLKQKLRARALQLAMWELAHQRCLTEALHAFNAAGVHPILMKGTPLAYSLYADPSLRTRADCDVLVPEAHKTLTHDLLLSLGYECDLGIKGAFVSYQSSYVRSVAPYGTQTLDVHWKVNNSEVLSRLFTHDELASTAQALPALCPHAVGPSPVHSMLLACMHRSTHKNAPYHVNGSPQHDANRLIWLYDIHLLAATLSPREWEELDVLARQKGLWAVLLEGLREAQKCFKTLYSKPLSAQLAESPKGELAWRYLESGNFRRQWMDLRALGNWPARLALLRELVFPDPAYMRTRAGHSGSTSLGWLYARRAIRGVIKRLAS